MTEISAAGRAWLVTTTLLLAIGVFRNINLLTLLGYVMLAVAVLNLPAAGWRLRHLRARRHVAGPAFAAAPCAVEVVLTNGAGGPCRGLRLEDGGALHAQSWFVGRLAAGATVAVSGQVVLPRRGRYAWGPVVVRSGHPFGLVWRRVELGEAGEVIVLPRLGWLHRGLLRHRLRGGDPRGEHSRQSGWRHRAAQAEIHGLRPFRPGDSPRWIHWRTSARRDELMVREFEDVPGENLLLVFDPSPPERMKDEGGRANEEPAAPSSLHPSSFTLQPFEEAVSLAATICWEWCRRTGDRLVLATAGPEPRVLAGVTGPLHANRLLEWLAVQEPAPAGDLATLLARLGPAVPPAGAVVVVAAGPSALADVLRRRLGRPVTALDAAAPEELDFYEAPGTGARPSPGSGGGCHAS